MSSEEHPPRGYLQRRKKLQKTSKDSSNINRRRSNTFHNKRDFEKPVEFDSTPHKCHSFRLPTEKSSDFQNLSDKYETVNIQNLLNDVRYQNLLKKRVQMGYNTSRQIPFPVNNSKETSDDRTDNQWLREVSSDSKIPLLFQMQYMGDEFARDNHPYKCPVRSLSDKHGKELAKERRENFQRRKNKKHLTSPDLFSNLSESLKARILAASSQQKVVKNRDPENISGKYNTNTLHKHEYSENVSFPSNIPLSSADHTTITVQLPKRKSKKTQNKTTQESTINAEQTFTLVIPKKRSLSSEKEYESSDQIGCDFELPENSQEILCYKSLTAPSTNIHSHHENKNLNRDNPMLENHKVYDNETLKDVNEQLSRKRKVDDVDSSSKDLSEAEDVQVKNHIISDQTNLSDNVVNNQDKSANKYIKSPSAPHLDWRKACAKKVSREGAPNVRSLIEKYNKVAEGQTIKSANSSNLSSPTVNRKISAPVYTSKSERNIPSHSFSTPTTPSIISASEFYNPLVFKPINLDLLSRSPPESPLSAARAEAIKRAKEQFIAAQTTIATFPDYRQLKKSLLPKSDEKLEPENYSPTASSLPIKAVAETLKRTDDDRMSNCSMDSMNLVMYRTGETCQESRFSKRTMDYSRQDSDPLERKNNLKTSKSLSNSSIFKTVLNSDFKMPSTLMKLKRSKRKKELPTVSHLCRQSLLLTPDDTGKVPSALSHKSCPSSPELKNKREVKTGWFHRNIFRHK